MASPDSIVDLVVNTASGAAGLWASSADLAAWRAVEQAIGRYLRQELALALTAALLLGAGYALLGLPYPSALALLAFFGWFIPLLGFAVILIPVFLSALGLGWGYVLLAVMV